MIGARRRGSDDTAKLDIDSDIHGAPARSGVWNGALGSGNGRPYSQGFKAVTKVKLVREESIGETMPAEPVNFRVCMVTWGLSMLTLVRTACVSMLFLSIVITGQVLADELKDQAVDRLAHSLEPAIPVALGKAVVRQAALLRARELLAEYGRRADLDQGWNASAPEWQAAEADLMTGVIGLIDSHIEPPEWFYAALRRETANLLDAEEADYIATHFTTPAGNDQRILLQMRLLADVLVANYTFTNRLNHTVPGLQDDLTELQTAYWKLEPFRVRDFVDDPQAIKFAGQGAGLKFTKMLAIQGMESFITHIDTVAAAALEAVNSAAPLIDDYVEAYRKRVAVTG